MIRKRPVGTLFVYTAGMDYAAQTRAAAEGLLAKAASQRALAKQLGIRPVTLNDLLLGKPMSDNRLNRIRESMSLPPVRRVPVLLDADNEYVSRKQGGKQRRYREFKVRVSPTVGDEIDAMLDAGGWKSFSEYMLEQNPRWNGR